MQRSVLFLPLFFATLGACDKPAPKTQPALTAIASLTSIDTSLTLGGWLAAHPDEQVIMNRNPIGEPEFAFCRIALSRHSIGNVTFERLAVFIRPNPPAGEAFPADTARIAERYCRLAAIWLEGPEPDESRATTVADSLTRVLAASLGEPLSGDIAFTGRGGAYWTSKASWRKPSALVSVAVVPLYTEYAGENNPPTVFPRRILLASYAPGTGEYPDLESMYAEHRARDAKDGVDPNASSPHARLDSALSWAELPALAADLARVVAFSRDTTIKNPKLSILLPLDSALLRAVRLVRDTASSLPPPRRAAAFLAVDMTVWMYAGEFEEPTDSRSRRPQSVLRRGKQLQRKLGELGLTYVRWELVGRDRYDRNWLMSAFEADSTSSAGRAAFMQLLANGWSTREGCRNDLDIYKQVIARGESALAAGHSDPMIRYHLAEAHGEAKDPGARARSLELYRQALEGVKDRQARRSAWNSAMRLMLGLSHHSAFYCAGD